MASAAGSPVDLIANYPNHLKMVVNYTNSYFGKKQINSNRTAGKTQSKTGKWEEELLEEADPAAPELWRKQQLSSIRTKHFILTTIFSLIWTKVLAEG